VAAPVVSIRIANNKTLFLFSVICILFII